MSELPKYKLTEEITRQAVEVLFKKDDSWHIAFSNPTAGPWKTINFEHSTSTTDQRYAKEENRPDLILLSQKQHFFLILEAKDNIGKLSQQLDKTMAVFKKEVDRIDKMLSKKKPIPTSHIVVGYIYPAIGTRLLEQQRLLLKVHSQLAQKTRDARLVPSLSIIIRHHDNGNLSVNYRANHLDADAYTTLQKLLPIEITPFK